MRNEPINEVSQIKGTAMSHPTLSPNDEFADFEIYNVTFGDNATNSQTQGSTIREALKDGLVMKERIGANPYKFGFIGSSNRHNASSPVEEDNYTGKIGITDMPPKRRLQAKDGVKPTSAKTAYKGKDGAPYWAVWSARSLAGVWAKSNTRESIFERLSSKESYATSGIRIKVRFFGSWNYDAAILAHENWLVTAYRDGIPMGSDLPIQSATSNQQFPLSWFGQLKMRKRLTWTTCKSSKVG